MIISTPITSPLTAGSNTSMNFMRGRAASAMPRAAASQNIVATVRRTRSGSSKNVKSAP